MESVLDSPAQGVFAREHIGAPRTLERLDLLMDTLIVSRKVCLSHELLHAAGYRTDVVFLPCDIMCQHVLVEVVPPRETLVWT